VVGEYGGGRSVGLGDGNETRTDVLPAGSGGRGFEAEVGALGSGFSVDGERDSLSFTLPKNDRAMVMCCIGGVFCDVLGLCVFEVVWRKFGLLKGIWERQAVEVAPS
jgi:hypothetical protein